VGLVDREQRTRGVEHGPRADTGDAEHVERQHLAVADGCRHLVVDRHRGIVAQRVRRRPHDDAFDRGGLVEGERADGRASQRPQVSAAAERGADVGRQRADERPRRAVDVELVDARIGVDRADVETVHGHRARLALDDLAGAGQLVQPTSVDAHGRHHRRDLEDLADERPGRGFDLGGRHGRHVVVGDDLTGGVEGRRLDAQHHLADVGLRQRGEEAQQPGHPADAEQQHAGGVGIERARVADLLVVQDPPGLGHHVVGGPPGRLVDHGEPVVPRRVAHASSSE
jgi:hypothetical protein